MRSNLSGNLIKLFNSAKYKQLILMHSCKRSRKFTRFNYRLGLQYYIICLPCNQLTMAEESNQDWQIPTRKKSAKAWLSSARKGEE